MKKFILFAIAVSLLVVGAFLFIDYQAKHSHGATQEERVFEVKKGEGAFDFARRLEAEGLVSSRYAFVWHLYQEKKLNAVVAGEYAVSGKLTIPEIAFLITEGKTLSKDIRVTFPEGFTMKAMAERLTANRLPGEEFLALGSKPKAEWKQEFDFLSGLKAGATLEGYLFPDTYLFAPDAPAETIVKTMLRTFGKKLDAELRNQIAASGKSIATVVTLASIIEEEGKSEADRRKISDIFGKRLAVGQPLQSDATVNYVLGTSRMQPTFKDIETDSLYNTYKYAGLPPGPISNPGLISLRAAVYPESNPYFYFLNNLKTGETIFSKTFEEHVTNRSLHGL